MPRTPPYDDIILPTVVESVLSCRAALAATGWGVSGSYEAGMSSVRSTDIDDSPWPTELHYGFRHLRAVYGGTPVVTDDYYWSAAPASEMTFAQAIRDDGLCAREMWGVTTDPVPDDDYWSSSSPDSAILQYLCYMAGAGAYSAQATYHSLSVTEYITLIQRATLIKSAADEVLGIVRSTNYYSSSSPPDPPFSEASMVFDASTLGSRATIVDARRIRRAIEEWVSSADNATEQKARLGSVWSVRGEL